MMPAACHKITPSPDQRRVFNSVLSNGYQRRVNNAVLSNGSHIIKTERKFED